MTFQAVLVVLNAWYNGKTCKPQIWMNEKLWHYKNK